MKVGKCCHLGRVLLWEWLFLLHTTILTHLAPTSPKVYSACSGRREPHPDRNTGFELQGVKFKKKDALKALNPGLARANYQYCSWLLQAAQPLESCLMSCYMKFAWPAMKIIHSYCPHWSKVSSPDGHG